VPEFDGNRVLAGVYRGQTRPGGTNASVHNLAVVPTTSPRHHRPRHQDL